MQTISISRLVKTYLMTFFMHLMSLIYYFFLLLWQSNQLCRSSTVCHQIKSFSISRNNCLFIIHSKNWSFLKELIRCSACFSAARIIPSPACFSSECSNNNGMRHKNNRPLQGWLFYFPSFLLPKEWSHFTLIYPDSTDAARSHSVLSLIPSWVFSGKKLAIIPNCMLHSVG